jgi:hypothetical protein
MYFLPPTAINYMNIVLSYELWYYVDYISWETPIAPRLDSMQSEHLVCFTLFGTFEAADSEDWYRRELQFEKPAVRGSLVSPIISFAGWLSVTPAKSSSFSSVSPVVAGQGSAGLLR